MPWLTHCTPSTRQSRTRPAVMLAMASDRDPKTRIPIRSLLADPIDPGSEAAPAAIGGIVFSAPLEPVAAKQSNSGMPGPLCAAKRHSTISLPAILCSDSPREQHSAYAPAAHSPSSSEASITDHMATTSTRAPRPSYSEEQRFFIMWTRVVLNMSWQEIELRYAKLFGQEAVGLRSRGGLTSVYYRIRKRWGMEEVLKTAPESSSADKQKVQARAQWMGQDYLLKVQYFCSYPLEGAPMMMGY